MHSVAMQGGMPMQLPQTMYMQGQQAMYMPAPAYGMPPGAPLPLRPSLQSSMCSQLLHGCFPPCCVGALSMPGQQARDDLQADHRWSLATCTPAASCVVPLRARAQTRPQPHC